MCHVFTASASTVVEIPFRHVHSNLPHYTSHTFQSENTHSLRSMLQEVHRMFCTKTCMHGMKMFLANLEMFSKKLSTAGRLKHKISSIPAGLSDAAVSAPPGLNVCAHLLAEASRVLCQNVRRPKRTCTRLRTHSRLFPAARMALCAGV